MTLVFYSLVKPWVTESTFRTPVHNASPPPYRFQPVPGVHKEPRGQLLLHEQGESMVQLIEEE